MGCESSKEVATYASIVPQFDYNDDYDNIKEDSIFSLRNRNADDAIIAELTDSNDHIEIQVADPQAFYDSFIEQRQQAIDNRFYRSTIESWQPETLEQLTETIRAFSEEKCFVDRHWIIFYWIACKIDYDTVSFFSGNYGDQTAERIFQDKKGVYSGYANLYKYLCDRLEMPCEVVNGYAKWFGLENSTDIPMKTNHAWNAVEIDGHWYLMDSTWGTGHLDDTKQFKRELASSYFFPRPNQMIYHHLPEDEKWQLLKTSIKMTQYLHMPHLWPEYFNLQVELISPRHQGILSLLPGKSYTLVLLRAPPDVQLVAYLKLNDSNIKGGHHIMFDKQQQFYRCYFAPRNIGRHKVNFYGKRGDSQAGQYLSAFDFILDVKEIPNNIVSFPKTWNNYFDLGLEVISPQITHLIKLSNGAGCAQILIKAPENVELLGHLESQQKQKVTGGHRVYYDRHKNIWRCNFAPDRNGVFDALIMAKKKTDPGEYASAVAFQIEAEQVPSPPISYPYTWPLFYDYDLKIEAPRNRSNAAWTDNISYAEVLINAPDDVQLSCAIICNDMIVANGSLIQYNNEKKIWQLLFAPERTGSHELLVYGDRNTDYELSSGPVAKFNLDVDKLERPMKFPEIYANFHVRKCQLHTPMDGILKKGSIIEIHCVIPRAMDVNVTVDSEWLESEGYTDPILRRQIKVGSKDVTIHAKFEEQSNYDALITYIVR